MTRVTVHMDRLVLNGFGGEDRGPLALGLTEEIVRVLGEPTAVRSLLHDRHVATLRVPLRSEPGATPSQVGAAAARAIISGIPR